MRDAQAYFDFPAEHKAFMATSNLLALLVTLLGNKCEVDIEHNYQQINSFHGTYEHISLGAWMKAR